MLSFGRVLSILCAVVCLLLAVSPVQADTEARGASRPQLRVVHVQLKWRHQYQFAGFYAAIEQGYFRDAGLDVRLMEGGPDIDPARTVSDGRAEFGIGTSSLLLDRAKGLPVVAVAAILQHSPFALAVRPDLGIDSAKDLRGHSLMLEAHADELMAFLKSQGVEPDRLRLRPHSGDIRDLEDRVDAASIYTTDEPYELISNKIAHQILSPRSAHIDFYGDTLFTTAALADGDPALVRAMRDALIKGWAYALDHQGQVIRLIHSRYAPALSPLKLQFEADEIRRLMDADVVAIGYMNPGRWQAIVQQFQKAALLPPDFDMRGFLFEGGGVDRRLLYLQGGALLVVSLVFLALLLLLRQRRRQLDHCRRLQAGMAEILRERSEADALTGLPNRRRLEARGRMMLAEMRKTKASLALLVIELDSFADIARRWGADVSDELLCRLAGVLSKRLGVDDLIGRYANERFAVIAPDHGGDEALRLAEELRELVSITHLPQGRGHQAGVSASIGVALLELGDGDLADLLERAERALFRAKGEGGNRVVRENVLLGEKSV